MRHILLFSFISLGMSYAQQSGCTDPIANNFSASASQNNGSCTYNVTNATHYLKGAFGSTITESSGLVFTDGAMWTHNDSGNPAQLFKVDTSNGSILQTVYVDNFPNIDWEDITADSNYFYVGDFGNNDGNRTDLKILKIAKKDIGTAATVHLNAQAISFSYSDQTSFVKNALNNYDCESVISIRSDLYIFTKNRGDYKTRVYKISKTPGTYSVSPFTELFVNGILTGADYNTQTKEIALIGYSLTKSNSFVWLLNEYTGDLFFSGYNRRIELGGSSWQTEAIAYAGNTLFISCETSGGINSSLYTIDQSPFRVTDIVDQNTISRASLLTFQPNPSSSLISIEHSQTMSVVEIYNQLGEVVCKKEPNSKNYTISLEQLPSGIYWCKAYTKGGQDIGKIVLNK